MKNSFTILGGGLTGLSAGYVLSKAGCSVTLFESDAEVGGLSKTIHRDGFRFDLGGHRFFTTDERIDRFVQDLMAGELVSVPRKSRIFMRGRYFDYPLKPLNALFGMGVATTARIIADYIAGRLRPPRSGAEAVSLEDWVVRNFGRAMFTLYFKEYSEKVWGLDCNRISVDWVAQRIRGLSLATAIKNAFFKFSGKDIPSLVDRFLYPALGIGRIAERLKEEIEQRNAVVTGARVERVNHDGACIESIEVRTAAGRQTVTADGFISSIPLPQLVNLLSPAPPPQVRAAAAALRFRDLIVVGVLLDRPRVTDLTWIYLPEKKIPFGRLHEPTNWSAQMAPPGKTVLVAEYFSFEGDSLWTNPDDALIGLTVEHLERLGFISAREVIGGVVVRTRKAYPLFEIGYAEHTAVLYDYLSRFADLHIAGRSGRFRYYNMDHALSSGMKAAEAALEQVRKRSVPSKRNNGKKPAPAPGAAQGDSKCAAH